MPSQRRDTQPAAFLLCALLAASPALAELPKVVVVPFTAGEGVGEQTASRFSQTVIDALRARTDLSLVSVPVGKAPQALKDGGRAAKPSPEAAAALEAGQKAAADLKFDEAYEKLKKGLELSLAEPAVADFSKLYEAHLQLAVAAFRLGEEKDAAAALTALARMNPQFEVPGSYPPIFLREWDKAKKRLAKQGTQLLTVDGPAGATAFIDGRDLGMVPVEEAVAPGPHYLKVEGTKGEKWGQGVEVRGAAVKVKAAFGGAGEKTAAPVEPKVAATLDTRISEKVQAWCAAAGADFAVVGVVWKSGEAELSAATALYWTRKEAFAALPVVSFPDGAWGAAEAGKIMDKIADRLESFGAPLALPYPLVQRAVARAPVPPPDELEVATARRPAPRAPDAAPPRLVPDVTPAGAERQVPIDEPPPEVATSGGGAKWVWIVVGVVAAAGVGVGTYFVVTEATRPVTGTVSATWP